MRTNNITYQLASQRCNACHVTKIWRKVITHEPPISDSTALAKHEGVNPYKHDWWDALDSVVIKETRQQGFKRPGVASITELKNRQAKLRREITWRETQLTDTKL
jgi:hypothetical protein